MKTVFSNSQCAHVWAQQNQPSGRSDNMSFEGAVIYSYRTPIARIISSPDLFNLQGRIALVTSQRYSTTTSSKHMPVVARALCGMTHSDGSEVRRFYVPNVMAKGRTEHLENLAYYAQRYINERASLARVRTIYDGSYFYNRLHNIWRNHVQYANCFGLPCEEANPQRDAADLLAAYQAREAKKQTPAYIAAQARKAAQKAAREERLRIEQIAAAGDALKEWRAGLRRDIAGYGRQSANGGAYLRLSADGRTVQTSLGASVPVNDARRMLLFIRNIVAQLRSTDTAIMEFRNGPTVGSFTLNRVEASGSVKIGCHFIEADELAIIAKAVRIDEWHTSKATDEVTS